MQKKVAKKSIPNSKNIIAKSAKPTPTLLEYSFKKKGFILKLTRVFETELETNATYSNPKIKKRKYISFEKY